MRTGFESEAKKMTIKRKWHSRWVKAVTVLASVTVFCTTYALILPAITMSTDTYCGHEEHKHDESCYERQLICVLEEGAEKEIEVVTEEVTVVTKEEVLVDAGHTHEEACYETETVLICDIEEVEAKEAVVDEETGEVIEEAVEGHTHSDACYETVETLVCGEEEREAVYEEQAVETVETVEKESVVEVAGHKHTDACYELVLKCTIEEHEHEDMCFSNKEAVEEVSDWEKTLPKANEMKKNPSEDIVLVAGSQVGYRESEENFVMVDGQRKGYTRYGAMFGKAYEDWNGMFVQFCMHYAGVSESYMKGNTDISKWIQEAQKKEIFFAADAEDFQVKAGDIVFFEKKVKEEKVNTVGIVEEVKEKNIIVIEGDDDNEVVRNKYNVEDKEIKGYAILPEKAEEVEAVVIEETVVENEEVTDEIVEEIVEEAPIAPNTGEAQVVLGESRAVATFYKDDTYSDAIIEDTAIVITGELPVVKVVNEETGEEVEELAVEVKAYKVDAPQIDETAAVLAYDITIFYKEGFAPEGSDGTFQPVTPVKVSFESDLLNDETVQGYAIYHIGDDGETEYCGGDNSEKEEGVVSFDAHHFSPYMVSIIDSGIQNDSYGAYPEEENEDEEETVIEETFSISSVFQKIRMLSNSSEAANALATKATVDGQTVYTVKSWTALEQLIEQGKYKDGDTTKSDAGNNLNIVIDGIIAAKPNDKNLKIASNKVVNLKGINDATIYVDSTAPQFNEMFWVNGGKFNVENVTFSGKKATASTSSSTTCKRPISNSVITQKNGKLYIDDKKLAKVGTKGLEANDSASDGNHLFLESAGNNQYYIKGGSVGDFWYLHSSGTFFEDNTGNKYKWTLRSDGVLANVDNPDIIIWKDPESGAVSVTNETINDCTPGPAWTIDDNSTIDSVNPTNGFFIAADEGAIVNLNSGAVFRDITYTGEATDIAPIYASGSNTKVNMNEGSLITNNVIRYPSIDDLSPEDLYTKGLNMRYTSDDPVGQGASIDEIRYQSKYFVETKSVGGVLVRGATLTLNSGSEISENVADFGAIRVIEGGKVIQNGGEIKDNLGFNSGAVSIQNGTYDLNDGIVSDNRGWWNGTISAMSDSAHVNIGKESCKYPYIVNNETLCKGGAVFVNSDNVSIIRGVMANNKAHVFGGAVYVNSGNTLVLQNTAITGNTASTSSTYGGSNSGAFYKEDIAGAGGGVWTCPTDKTYYNIKNVHIWGNTAQNGVASDGDDFYQIRPYYGGGELRLFDSGDKWDVYYTTGAKGASNRRDEYKENLDEPEYPLANRTGVALVNKSPHSYTDPTTSTQCTENSYNVIIRDNTATNGGGVASNGILAFVDNSHFENVNAKLSIIKEWDDSVGVTPSNKPEIKLTVSIKDQNDVEVVKQEVVLGDGNFTYAENLFDTIVKENTAQGDYKVTFELPTLYYTNNDGEQESVYKALPLTANATNPAEIGDFDADGLISINKDALKLWSIEIKEQVKVDGEYVDGSTVYDLTFDELYGIYEKPAEKSIPLPSGARFTTQDHNYLLSTKLTNDNKYYNGKVQITKKDSATENLLDSEEFTFEYRKVTKSGSVYSEIEGTEGEWHTFNKASGVHTTDLLDANSYYEIKESATLTGYTGLGDGRIYVYVDEDGNTSIDSHTGINGNISETTTSTLTEPNVQGQLIAFDVFNKRETGLEIVKVSDQTDENGDAIPVAGGTTFQIKNFNFGSTNNSMSTPVTITLTEDNSFRLTDVMAAFANTGMTEKQILESKFYIQETDTHENDRYEGLQHVIPFRIEKKNGVYKFIPFKKSDISNVAPDPKTDSKFYKAGTNRSVINNTVYVEWESDGENIKDVTIERSEDNASIKYIVTNKMKPIEVKVAKLDENGDPLASSNIRFSLRPAKRTGNGLYGTNNNGVLTFNNESSKIGSGITLETGKAYALWEEEAPEGYAVLGLSIIIKVDENGIVSLVSSEDELKNTANYDLDGTAKQIADAVANGTVSVSDTVDDNGVVTINVKNYPKTSLKVKKEWDPSAEAHKPAGGVNVDLYADDVNMGSDYRKLLNNGNNWSAEWTDLPKFKSNPDTSEGAPALLEIEYTVKEVFDGTSNNFKVAYDYTPEVVEQRCDTTRRIVGWQDTGVANISGRYFRIVSNGRTYYLDGGTLKTTTIDDSANYSKMLWTTKNYTVNGGYHKMGFQQVVNGTTYYIAYSERDYRNLVASRSVYSQFWYSADDQYMDYGNNYNSARMYVNGNLTTSTSSTNQVTFQVPVYEDNTTCETNITPAEWLITNYYDTVDLDFEKKWVGDGQYPNKPTSLTVDLLVNGNVYEGKEITVSAATGWKGSWKELPMYYDGELAVYSAQERLNDDHYTTTIERQTGTGGSSVIIGWREISYTELKDNQPFRLVAQGNAYYLDSNNRLKTTSKNSSAYYDRMLWETTKYETGNYYNGYYTPVVELGFRSAFNPNYYINTSSSTGYLTASTQPQSYTYIIRNNQIVYLWGGYEHSFSGIIEQHCNGFMTFEVPIYDSTSTNDKLVMTNTYNEHKGLKLTKVDENGNSSNWSKQAEFKLYHMRGQLGPYTLTLDNGEYFVSNITGNMVPSNGYNYFFLVEETMPEQTGDNGTVTYAKLGTAIPIKIGTDGVATLIDSESGFAGTWFAQDGHYNSATKELAKEGNRPAIKVDWDLIGTGKAVTYSTDQKRLMITAKNTPLENELELFKIDSTTAAEPLDGAEFTIKNETTGNLVEPSEGGYWTTVDGKWKATNLPPGTYTITEVNAPRNYMKSDVTVSVVVDDYGKITVTPSDTNVVVNVKENGTTSVSFKFKNAESPFELPETGGIGTTILTVIGALMTMLAAALLAVRVRLARSTTK